MCQRQKKKKVEEKKSKEKRWKGREERVIGMKNGIRERKGQDGADILIAKTLHRWRWLTGGRVSFPPGTDTLMAGSFKGRLSFLVGLCVLFVVCTATSTSSLSTPPSFPIPTYRCCVFMAPIQGEFLPSRGIMKAELKNGNVFVSDVVIGGRRCCLYVWD